MSKALHLFFGLMVAVLVPTFAFASSTILDGTTNAVDQVRVDTNSIYFGMEVPFSSLSFTVGESFTYSENTDSAWEYYDGFSWSEVSITSSGFNDFKTVNTTSISFDAPYDWSKSTFSNGIDKAYWLRYTVNGEVLSGSLDAVSAVAYFAEVSIQNSNGDGITNLTKDNFSVSGGSDNKVYGVLNMGSGVYRLALNSYASYTDYKLVITVPGYHQIATDLSMDANNNVSLSVSLTGDEACAPSYYDIAYHWAQSAVRELYCRQILQITSSEFNPNVRVSRAEFLKMALVNAGVDTFIYTHKYNPFSDVNADEDWYAEYALAAYHLGAIDGETYFSGDYSLNRAEAVSILIRLAGMDPQNSSTHYNDITSSDWFARYVRAASDMGVVEGYTDGSFQGERYLSRAESAVMVNNMFYAKYDQ